MHARTHSHAAGDELNRIIGSCLPRDAVSNDGFTEVEQTSAEKAAARMVVNIPHFTSRTIKVSDFIGGPAVRKNE